MTKNIKILGHRGVRNRLLYGENTLSAFEYALSTADGIEADVVLSRDGVPYLLHDTAIRFIPYVASAVFTTWRKNVDAMSWDLVGGRDFYEMHSSEVDEILLKSGDDIPRLSDLFALMSRHNGGKRKTINLELKAPESARPVLEAIDLAEKKDQIDRGQIIISSFDHNEIAMVQKIDPSMRTGLIFWHDSVRPCRLYPRREKYLSQALPISIKNLEDEKIRRILPDYFVLPAKGLTAAYNDALAQEYPKAKIIVWTPGSEPLPLPSRNKVLFEKLSDPAICPRIAAIITNHPEEMKGRFCGAPDKPAPHDPF